MSTYKSPRIRNEQNPSYSNEQMAVIRRMDYILTYYENLQYAVNSQVASHTANKSENYQAATSSTGAVKVLQNLELDPQMQASQVIVPEVVPEEKMISYDQTEVQKQPLDIEAIRRHLSEEIF